MTISHFRPRAGLALLAAIAVALLLIAAAPFAHAARARRAARPKSCDVTAVAGTLGPTSVSSVKVTGVRCDAGISVVRAFHACRLRNGPSGRCVRYVNGYACAEIRTNGPTSFSASVMCRKDRKTVSHRYVQNV